MVSSGWLPAFEEYMDAVPKIGILGPVDRDWSSGLVKEDGKEFFGGTHFHWSDAYWLFRSDLIPELQTQKLSVVKGLDINHPGYFYFNLFAFKIN